MADMTLNDDGTITASVAGFTTTLRPPVLDELFGLWALSDSLARKHEVDAVTLARAARAAAEAMVTTDPEAREAATKLVAGNEPTRIRQLRSISEWMEDAFTTLADPPLPPAKAPTTKKAAADTPAVLPRPGWWASGELQVAMLNHWQTVPLDLGAQSE